MKVLILEPGKMPYAKEIDGELETLQEIVGGWVEVIYPHDDDSCIICNEEGKILGLEYNREVRNSIGRLIDVIVGTFIICNAPYGSDEFASLTDEQIEYYTDKYMLPLYYNIKAENII